MNNELQELRLFFLGQTLFDKCMRNEGVNDDELKARFEFLKSKKITDLFFINIKSYEDLIKICQLHTSPNMTQISFKNLPCDIIIDMMKNVSLKELIKFSVSDKTTYECVKSRVNKKLGLDIKDIPNTYYIKISDQNMIKYINIFADFFEAKVIQLFNNEFLITFKENLKSFINNPNNTLNIVFLEWMDEHERNKYETNINKIYNEELKTDTNITRKSIDDVNYGVDEDEENEYNGLFFDNDPEFLLGDNKFITIFQNFEYFNERDYLIQLDLGNQSIIQPLKYLNIKYLFEKRSSDIFNPDEEDEKE